jgi:hypothetical protein
MVLITSALVIPSEISLREDLEEAHAVDATKRRQSIITIFFILSPLDKKNKTLFRSSEMGSKFISRPYIHPMVRG